MKSYLSVIPLTAMLLWQCSPDQDTPISLESSAPAPQEFEQKMVLIKGATYTRGSEGKQDNGKIYREEAPVHQVTVSDFYIDNTEVTNAQFKAFVDATGYKTFAERPLSDEIKNLFPNASADQLVPGCLIFSPPSQKTDPHKNNVLTWWKFVEGATWQHPEGPGSSIEDKMNHPVVCVNHDDAKAYAEWAGKRLPTEAEWELAARGGLVEKKYTWGDVRKTEKWKANCFQGDFPSNDSGEDGYVGSAPVGCYEPNGFGLYDMAGNVWEMCSDIYDPTYYSTFKENPVENPKGPKLGYSLPQIQAWNQRGVLPAPDPNLHHINTYYVTKGGSFLCHFSYCLRYRPAARHRVDPFTPTNHTGFRCAKDVTE